MGQVTVWKMTEEERLSYIEKHPIRPTKPERTVTFPTDYPDWKWRSEKAVPESVKARKNNGR